MIVCRVALTVVAFGLGYACRWVVDIHRERRAIRRLKKTLGHVDKVKGEW